MDLQRRKWPGYLEIFRYARFFCLIRVDSFHEWQYHHHRWQLVRRSNRMNQKGMVQDILYYPDSRHLNINKEDHHGTKSSSRTHRSGYGTCGPERPSNNRGRQCVDLNSRIAPIKSEPAGQSYGRWAAEWWQWALGVPAVVNPLTDTTGDNCAQRQVDKVWFLAGSVTTDPIVRTCEVPARKSLFFPLINTMYGAFLNDPPETRTDQFVRTSGACTQPAQISV